VAVGIAVFPLVEAQQSLVSSDWSAFAVGGRLAVQRDPDLLYNRAEQVRVQKALTGGVRLRPGDQGDLLPFDQPPWVALLNAPFAAMVDNFGARAWILVELAAMALGLGLLLDGDKPRWRVLVPFAAVPTALMALNAQIDGLVVLGLGAGFALWRTDRKVLAGCALGLCLAKPHLMVGLALLLLVAGERRVLAGWALAAAGLVAAAVLRDPRWPAQWLAFLAANAGHIGGELTPVGVALHLPIGPAPATALALAALTLVVAGTALLANLRREVPPAALAVVIAGSLLVAPHALGSDLVLGAAALALGGGSRRVEWVGLSAAALAIAVTHDSLASTTLGIALLAGLTLRLGLGEPPMRVSAPASA
jgi:hypothetical protein